MELVFVKQCSRCKRFKTHTEFHKAPTTRDGVQSRCKACQAELAVEYRKAHPDKCRAQHKDWARRNRRHLNKRQREWHKKNPGKSSEYELKQHYGLPPGSYAKMLAEQDGKCAVCGADKPNGRGRFHVDHCHATKVIRGLLCSNCNLLMGHAKENPDLLRAAINYLHKYSAK